MANSANVWGPLLAALVSPIASDGYVNFAVAPKSIVAVVANGIEAEVEVVCVVVRTLSTVTVVAARPSLLLLLLFSEK